MMKFQEPAVQAVTVFDVTETGLVQKTLMQSEGGVTTSVFVSDQQ